MEYQTNNTANSEVDLSQVSKKLKGYIHKVNDSFFDGILFIKRYIITISVLLVAGIALGVYLDMGVKTYTHKVFVIPNFDSTDYLYEEIDRINTKIKEHDYTYLKSIGIKQPKKISKIIIEPVVDIYEFIDETQDDQMNRRLDLFKIISENGDVEKIIEDKTTSKNYKNHIITITTRGKSSQKEIIDPLLAFFNSNSYYKQIQAEYIKNIDIKTVASEGVIKQIDGIIGDFSSNVRAQNDNIMYYNDNTQVNELINIKNKLIRDLGRNRINKINYTHIVKDCANVLNIKAATSIGGTMKIMIPLLFLFVFACITKFKDYYKKQVLKRQYSNT